MHKVLPALLLACVFETDMNTPRTPAIAVAAGSHVYVYRNLRPYFKFTLPSVDIASGELDVWDQLKAGSVTADKAFETLSGLR